MECRRADDDLDRSTNASVSDAAPGGRLRDATPGRRDRHHADLRAPTGLELGLSRGAAGAERLRDGLRRPAARQRLDLESRPDRRSSSSTIRRSSWRRTPSGWGISRARGPEWILSNLFAVQANRAYLLKIDGNQPVTWTVTGTPEVQTYRWAPDSFNLVGFPVDPQQQPTFGQFLAPSPAHVGQPIYRLVAGQWQEVASPFGTAIQSGEAYWVYCKGPSDYSGPIAIELEGGKGMDFAASGDRSRVRIRNLTHRTGVDLAASAVESGADSAGDPKIRSRRGRDQLAYAAADLQPAGGAAGRVADRPRAATGELRRHRSRHGRRDQGRLRLSPAPGGQRPRRLRARSVRAASRPGGRESDVRHDGPDDQPASPASGSATSASTRSARRRPVR